VFVAMKRARGLVAGIVCLALSAPGPVSLASGSDDLARGIREVAEGDFENAVLTLDAAARALSRDPAQVKELAQAYLHLGIAYVALGQGERARASFKEALLRDKDLRLSPDRYSPKVITAFEDARRETQAARAEGKRSKTPFILLGAGAAGLAVGAIALAGGGSEPSPPPTTGDVRLTGARFATPVLVCPDGSQGLDLPLAIDFEAANTTGVPVGILSVSSTLIIVTSPAVPSEVGFASSRETMVVPGSVPALPSATLRASTVLTCANGTGDAPRFNEWSGRLTVSTSAGIFTLETADRLRVNIP